MKDAKPPALIACAPSRIHTINILRWSAIRSSRTSMRTRRTIYLHIGTHKTGTTALQNFFSNNSHILEAGGVVYPRSGRPISGNGHHDIAFELYEKSRMSCINSPTDALFREIEAHHYDVIISSEELVRAVHYATDEARTFVSKLYTFFDCVSIIIYFRNQPSFLTSNYIERLKYGFNMTFNEYAVRRLIEDIDEFPLDYNRLMTTIISLNPSNVIARSYDNLPSGGIVPDFLEIIGNTANFPISREDVNVSQPAPEAFKKYFENCVNRPAEYYESLAISTLLQNSRARKLTMNGQLRSVLLKAFEGSNQQLKENWDVSLNADATSAQHGIHIDWLFSQETIQWVLSFADALKKIDLLDDALQSAQKLAIERYDQLSQRDRDYEDIVRLSATKDAEISRLQNEIESKDRLLAKSTNTLLERAYHKFRSAISSFKRQKATRHRLPLLKPNSFECAESHDTDAGAVAAKKRSNDD